MYYSRAEGMAEDPGRIYPEYQVVLKNKLIQITCNSFGKKTWYRGFKRLSWMWQVKGNVFIPRAREESDAGIYTCHGRLENGKRFERISKVLVGGGYVNIVHTVYILGEKLNWLFKYH